MTFTAQLAAAWQQNQSLLCVGLDPDTGKMPPALAQKGRAGILQFCCEIVDATADLVCAYKPQIAYFAAHGAEEELRLVIEHIHRHYPSIPVILDAKRGDIGSTASQYAVEAFVRYQADAVTVNPYMGHDTLAPWLAYRDKGVILLCRTSNPGGSDLQFLDVCGGDGKSEKLYQRVARLAAQEWNSNGQCALVVGATFPNEIKIVRDIVGTMPLLVPGIGQQGGDIAATLAAGQTRDGTGLIINSSRAILYAKNDAQFAQAARAAAEATQQAINQHRHTTSGN